MLTPEQFVEGLRGLLQQIPDVKSLTPQERALLRNRARTPDSVVQASINFIGTSDKVSGSIGPRAGEVRQLVDDANRWEVVESELKGMLKGISDANLVRRQRAGVIATQAYGIGQQLALDPDNAVLRPHVEEIKRLKRLARRKKAPPESPQPPLSDVKT